MSASPSLHRGAPPRWPGAVGALAAAAAVAAGAFGAHALADVLTPARLATFETAVRYQLIHAVGLVAVQAALAAGAAPPRALARAAALLAGGTAVFSGALYLLVASDVGAWGAVAPIGGVAMIAGWTALAWAFLGRPER
ncbi:MAG: DUF423 domain-containing protein [Trueperaceae bacterium]|nr:DUF423 domain-containing protein [Trueperaceae bacterium]